MVRSASTIIIPFLIALFLSMISLPLLAWLQRYGLPRWLSVVITVTPVAKQPRARRKSCGSTASPFDGDVCCVPASDIAQAYSSGLSADWPSTTRP